MLDDVAWRWVPARTNYPFNTAVDFAYVLRNPNGEFGSTKATLVATMYDANGRPYFTDELPVWPVRPGETIVGGTQSFPDREPAEVRFKVLAAPDAWVPADRWEPAGFKPLEVSGLTLARSTGEPAPDMVGFPAGYSYFTGAVDNPNPTTFKQFAVDVLHIDAKGGIVAHYGDFGENLPPNGRARFRIDVPDRLPPGDRYEAYARPWYESEDGLPIRADNQ